MRFRLRYDIWVMDVDTEDDARRAVNRAISSSPNIYDYDMLRNEGLIDDEDEEEWEEQQERVEVLDDHNI